MLKKKQVTERERRLFMENNKRSGKKVVEQSGRSMVEMLSVVSIIGILTVCGIAGYSVLMEKHRNNQLLQDTTIAAVAVSSQLLAGHTPTDESLPQRQIQGHDVSLAMAPKVFEQEFKGRVDANALEIDPELCKNFDECEISPEDNEFAIGLSDVSPSVCRFFVQVARSLGLIQYVYDSNGDELDEASCGRLDDDSSSSGSTTSSTRSSSSKKIYLVYRSDMALDPKKVDGAVGSSRELFCNDHGDYTNYEGTPACKCDTGWSGNKCSEEQEKCSGHGQFYVTTLGEVLCSCDEGYTGETCSELVGYSPCQTLDEKGNRGFKASGTSCTQAGVQGTCDEKGHCKPVGGTKCNGVSDCFEKKGGYGYFCNYGGHYGSHQGGDTPNVCEKTNPESFEYQGATFYYNSDKDLRSWCRAADGNTNCVWGFLSYYGAQSWCESLGAKLVDADYIQANCAEFEKHLPRVLSEQPYWTATTETLVSIGGNCKTGTTFRKDGYANNGGVVCIKGEPSRELPYCATHECILHEEIKETLAEASAVCGGIDNVVSLADIGCTSEGCTNPTHTYVWTKDTCPNGHYRVSDGGTPICVNDTGAYDAYTLCRTNNDPGVGPGIGGGSGLNWLPIEGCDCDTKKGISKDASDDVCNIQCCIDKYGNNGYAVNKVCCKKDDDDCICAANGCKTGDLATPLDDFCCAKAQGLI